MGWGEEQDKLTQEARLSLASPEVVFQELKNLSGGLKVICWAGMIGLRPFSSNAISH